MSMHKNTHPAMQENRLFDSIMRKRIQNRLLRNNALLNDLSDIFSENKQFFIGNGMRKEVCLCKTFIKTLKTSKDNIDKHLALNSLGIRLIKIKHKLDKMDNLKEFK